MRILKDSFEFLRIREEFLQDFFFLMVVRDSVLLRVLGLKSRIRLIVLGTLEDCSGIVPGTP